jgi:predicted CXXCH cytochrome family protein
LETRGREPGLILNFKKMAPAQASEACIRCHEQNACAPGSQWRTSKHAHANLSCISCHTAHYNVPPGTKPTAGLGEVAALRHAPDRRDDSVKFVAFQQPPDIETLRLQSNNLGAIAPDTCFRCHGEMKSLQDIAGPHQIGGTNGFNCTTCHNAHGNVLESSRKNLCLECHKQDSPTMAWHSSTHAIAGVACTDCHNPHPHAGVPRFTTTSGVDLANTHLSHQKRRPMSVQEPEACYKCHQNIFALTHLPSHHPIREGKMVCSDCHDAHGQLEGNLKAESKNLLCWKCHADKQGPFAYEHPPVTEDCGICHEPHGTVTNNLLKQPATFLCLRCHVGHRDGNHGGGARVNIDTIPEIRQGFYTDCTTCHSNVHGSDLPTPHFPANFR